MSATIPRPIRRIVVLFAIVGLVLPVGVGVGATSQAEPPVETVKTLEEMRGQLRVSAQLIQDGDREAAASNANDLRESTWTTVEGRVSSANESLAASLEGTLGTAPEKARTLSAEEYRTWVETEVDPKVVHAERALVDDSTRTNATYNARIVAGLLQHGSTEYAEAVSESGEVTDRVEYLTSASFVQQAAERYRTGVRPTVSDHANEELSELFEKLSTRMNESAAPGDVRTVSDSTRAELAEYTGLGGESNAADSSAIERVESDLDAAYEAYEANDSAKAKEIIHETYLANFEGLEGPLIQNRPELVEDLEASFNEELPGLIEKDAPPEDVRAKIDQMKNDLETAEGILESEGTETISLGVSNTTSTTESATGTTAGPTSTSTPGFGILAVLGALTIALGIRRSRR